MKQKHIYEHMDYKLNSYAQLTKVQSDVVSVIITNMDKTMSLGNIDKIAKKLNCTLRGVKNRISRLLNQNILIPINRNFRGEGVYLLKFKDNEYKIGYSKNVASRIKKLQVDLPKFNIIGVYCKPQYNKLGLFTMNARQVENIFKDKFASFNSKKDIFDRSEYYRLNKDQLVVAVKQLDALHLDWARSFNVLTIDYKHKGAETYKDISLRDARKSILNCKLFD